MDNTPFFKPRDLYDIKKKYFKIFTQNFMSKLDVIKNKLGAQNFNDLCDVAFTKKHIKKNFTGQTVKQEGIVICFPKQPEMKIKILFEKLFSERASQSIIQEKDSLKQQLLPLLRNVKVVYWSDYFLHTKNKEQLVKKLPVRFLNINEEGFSYNDNEVSKKSITLIKLITCRL